jgi:hypothetical protein
MTDTQFKATLEMLVPLVIKEIGETRGITEREAFELLYALVALRTHNHI